MLLCIDAFDIGGSRRSSDRHQSSVISISKLYLSFANVFSPPQSTSNSNNKDNVDNKLKLFNLLSQVPSNQSTSKQLTTAILQATSILENECPTLEENMLQCLVGNWELIWTAQDKTSLDNDDGGNIWRRLNPFATFINPCE